MCSWNRSRCKACLYANRSKEGTTHEPMRPYPRRFRQRRSLLIGRRGRGTNWRCRKESVEKLAPRILLQDIILRQSTLHVMQFNAQSVRSKLDKIRSQIIQEKPSVVLIQEDWLPDRFGHTIFGYKWYHQSRIVPHSSAGPQLNGVPLGGGVSILIRKFDNRIYGIETLPELVSSEEGHEVIALKIRFLNPSGIEEIYLVNVYRPPMTPELDLEKLLEPIFASDSDASVLLCGDVNAHSKLWDRSSKEDAMGKNRAVASLQHPGSSGDPFFIRAITHCNCRPGLKRLGNREAVVTG